MQWGVLSPRQIFSQVLASVELLTHPCCFVSEEHNREVLEPRISNGRSTENKANTFTDTKHSTATSRPLTYSASSARCAHTFGLWKTSCSQHYGRRAVMCYQFHHMGVGKLSASVCCVQRHIVKTPSNQVSNTRLPVPASPAQWPTAGLAIPSMHIHGHLRAL